MRSISLTFGILVFVSCGFENASRIQQDDSPSDLIKQAYQEIQARYLATVQSFDGPSGELRITTINVGMLSTILVKVPEYQRRRSLLVHNLNRHIDSTGTNVFFFQELWHAADRKLILEFAAENGFVAILDDEDESLHGLNTLVSRELIEDEAAIQDTGFERLGSQYTKHKGVLETHITLRSGKSVSLINAHLSFGFSDRQNEARLEQVSTVAKAMVAADGGSDEMNFIKKSDFYVFGGDFNLSPEMENARESEAAGWERNKLGYVELFDIAEPVRLVDSFLVKNEGSPGYTQDRNRNPITAISRSTRTEPEQRLDYILIASSEASFRIEQSRIVFDEAIVDEGGEEVMMSDGQPLLLSDHLGVFSVVELGR